MRATQLVLRHAYAIDIAILAIDGITSTINGSCEHGPERRIGSRIPKEPLQLAT